MKRFPITFVVAVLMAAVSAPAQARGDLRGERNVRGGIVSSRPHVGAHLTGARPVARQNAGRFERGAPRVVRSDHRAPVRRVSSHGRGYWKTVCEPVLVEAGHWHREYVPAVYGWAFDPCGHRFWGIVEPACHRNVWVPARYEDRHHRVWVSY